MSDTRTISRRRVLGSGLGLVLAASVPGAFAQVSAAARAPLRIGYQKGYLSILRGRGTLEKKLAPLGVTVQWTEFPSGPPQLEALNVGAIDFGDVGEAPPVFAQAAGSTFVYYGQTVPRQASEAILVPAASTVTSVSGLKGKRIALTKGSNTHFLLIRLLEKAGLKYGDVTPVWLSPADARAAFEQGSVDAWAIWDPFLAVAQVAGKARILADGTGVVSNRAYYFTSTQYVGKNEDVLRLVLEEIGTVDQWIKAHPDDAVNEFSGLWGLPRETVKAVFARLHFGTESISKAALDDQQRIADTFFDLKLIPRKIDVYRAVPPSFVRS